jgi:hypothetical protein
MEASKSTSTTSGQPLSTHEVTITIFLDKLETIS